MKKIAVITGVAGQDGAYLADFLLKKNYRVIGLSLSLKKEQRRGLDFFGIRKKVTLVQGDINSPRVIKRLLLKYHPHEFYNLAGQSSVARSWEDFTSTFKANGLAVIQMLELIKKYSPQTRFFECSSAEIFGDCRRAVNENCSHFAPVNPYGVSKLVAHLAVKSFRERHGLFAVNGVLFNHESPLRPDFMATKKIAKGAAQIALGAASRLSLGNLNISRDWGFAGDFVEAMWLMLNQPTPRDFIICTGHSLSLKKFVAAAFKYAGIKNWQKFVALDRKLVRKTEIHQMRGSPRQIKRVLGWRPQHGFRQLVKIMVDYELEKLQK